MKFPSKIDPFRVILSYALVDVSGIPVPSLEEARKVMAAVPSAIVQRVFTIYKGSVPPTRKFVTANVYKAPLPVTYARKVLEDETAVEELADKAEHEMVEKFGKTEVEEAHEIERQIVRGARKTDGYRGAVKVQ